MNRFKLIALTLPLALSSAAFAADSAASGSEFEHQAAGGKIEVTPGFTFGSIKQNYSSTYSTTSSSTDSIFNFSVGGEYGINDMISVGLKLGYQTDSVSFSPDTGNKFSASGMTDPVLYENTKMDVGPGSLRFGANLDISTGNATTDDSDPNKTKANELSGGITFTPFVGYELNVGPGIVGGRLSYDVVQTNRKTKDKTSGAANPDDTTTKGGNALTFAAFWEMNFHPVIWGVDLGVVNRGGTSTSHDNRTNAAFNDDHNSQTNFFVETYAAWEVAPDINILPKIGYGQLGQFADAASTSTAGIYLMVAARFGF